MLCFLMLPSTSVKLLNYGTLLLCISETFTFFISSGSFDLPLSRALRKSAMNFSFTYFLSNFYTEINSCDARSFKAYIAVNYCYLPVLPYTFYLPHPKFFHAALVAPFIVRGDWHTTQRCVENYYDSHSRPFPLIHCHFHSHSRPRRDTYPSHSHSEQHIS